MGCFVSVKEDGSHLEALFGTSAADLELMIGKSHFVETIDLSLQGSGLKRKFGVIDEVGAFPMLNLASILLEDMS